MSNAFFLYAADSMEVERHLFITNIIVQFVSILIISFIVDSELFNLILNKIFKRNDKSLSLR